MAEANQDKWRDDVIVPVNPITKISCNDIKLLIVGKPGVGKSTVGDLLLNRDQSQQRSQADIKTTSFNGKSVIVYDNPGQTNEKIVSYFRSISPGPHAILFVINWTDTTQEDVDYLERFEELFGNDVIQHMLVICTHQVVNKESQDLKSNNSHIKYLQKPFENQIVFCGPPASLCDKDKLQNFLYDAIAKLIKNKNKLECQLNQGRLPENELLSGKNILTNTPCSAAQIPMKTSASENRRPETPCLENRRPETPCLENRRPETPFLVLMFVIELGLLALFG